MPQSLNHILGTVQQYSQEIETATIDGGKICQVKFELVLLSITLWQSQLLT